MVLADSLGFHLNEIQKFYIGGAFGNYLDLEKAVNIGLLPDLPLERMQFIGNSSITGAKMAMLSYEALQKAEEIARMMTYLELSVKPGYMDQFVSALFLPHTDINLFPSVREKLHLA